MKKSISFYELKKGLCSSLSSLHPPSYSTSIFFLYPQLTLLYSSSFFYSSRPSLFSFLSSSCRRRPHRSHLLQLLAPISFPIFQFRLWLQTLKLWLRVLNSSGSITGVLSILPQVLSPECTNRLINSTTFFLSTETKFFCRD